MSFEDRIAKLECWRGKPKIEPLSGGLSTRSFKVSDFGGDHVVRIGSDIPVHHVSRKQERAVSYAAAQAQISPKVTYFEDDLLVIDFIHGQTMTEADMKPNLRRIIDVIRNVHDTMALHLRGSVNIFWVFHVLRDYVGLLKDQSQDLSEIEKLISTLEKLQEPLPIIVGHHDLLPANIIDDGKRLWLIDWEYGGFGTAMFDLANISANGNFDAHDDKLMLDHYFQGKNSEPLVKSFDAMKIASSLREMLWAKISAHYLALPDIDYAAHEAEYKKRSDAAIAQFEIRYGYTL